MRFKTFLAEASDPLAKYRKNLDIVIDKGVILYRGMRTEDKFKVSAVGDTTLYEYPARKEPRMSKIGMNVFLDLGSAWEGFPNRRMSAFATQKAKHATMFGKVGVIIPADNVSVFGYSPTDFNESKGKSAPAQHRKQIEGVIGYVHDVLRAITMAIANIEPKENEFRLRLLDALTDYGVEELEGIAVYRMNFGKKVMKIAELVDWSIRYQDKLRKMEGDTNGYAEGLLNYIQNLKEKLAEEKIPSVVDLFKSVSPEKYKAKAYTSLTQIPARDTASETWFEGDFLFVEMSLGAQHFSRDDIINKLKQLRDQA